MEMKGKRFKAEVPKALKNIDHQKSSVSVSSGGSAPFMTSMLSSEGQACISSEAQCGTQQKLCQCTEESLGKTSSFQQAKALKSQLRLRMSERIGTLGY